MNVVVLGEALCDFFALDAQGRPTMSAHAHRFVRVTGGAPTNFAFGLVRRGISVALLSELGDDPMGAFLMAELTRAGVDVSGVRQSKRAKTGISFIQVDPAGERSFDFYCVPSSDMLIDADTVRGRLPGKVLFHFGTNSMIFPGGREAIAMCVASVRAAGGLVSCDLNARPHNWPSEGALREQALWAAKNCDWLKTSDEELALLGVPPERLCTLGPSLIAFTEGPRGARIFTRDGLAASGPTLARTIVDTTGAGDAFYSAFVAAELQGGSHAAALQAGSEHAAEVIAHIGAT